MRGGSDGALASTGADAVVKLALHGRRNVGGRLYRESRSALLSVLVSIVLQDELLEVQESPLVRHLLPDLYLRFPGILGCQSRTVWTLTILDDVLDLKHLLQDRRC